MALPRQNVTKSDTAVQLLHAHEDLSLLLNALSRLSSAQLSPLSEQDWEKLLDRKQQLLDAISDSEPFWLFERTVLEAERLRKADRELAEKLTTAIDANRERFLAIAALEEKVRNEVGEQVTQLRKALGNLSLHKKAHGLYHPKPSEPSPRFLDGMR